MAEILRVTPGVSLLCIIIFNLVIIAFSKKSEGVEDTPVEGFKRRDVPKQPFIANQVVPQNLAPRPIDPNNHAQSKLDNNLPDVLVPQQGTNFLRKKVNPNIASSENRNGGAYNTGVRRRQPIKISESVECASDVKAFCSERTMQSNFDVMDCLQSDLKMEQEVTATCQDYIWHYKMNLTTDPRFEGAAGEVCREALQQVPECSLLDRGRGEVIGCLIERQSNVTSQQCRLFLRKMAAIVFSDYHLVNRFAEACNTDITAQKCGRLSPQNDDSPHSQGRTIECLSEKVKDLTESCKHQILRVAELQADDYHMDRSLFFACRDDRERFCESIRAGEGKVYKCLFAHKFKREMSDSCREKLTRRQRLMQENFKVNKGLVSMCQRDITRHHCDDLTDPDEQQHVQMSAILLCLESAIKDEGEDTVSAECVGELRDMRQSLLSDYRISPNIILYCADEVDQFCDKGTQREGRTLACLMDLARPDLRHESRSKISPVCRRELEAVLMAADVGEDFNLDPVLHDACHTVADHVCHSVHSGHAEVISCLMNHLGSDDMNDECAEKLLEIQYFITRNFKMDPKLYMHCRKDAVKQCSADSKWFDPNNNRPEQGPLVFSCLYRHMQNFPTDPEKQLSRACQFEVRRAMRQRSESVELQPEVEMHCLNDLASHCMDRINRGEEMHCLQDHLEFISDDCAVVVGNFTQQESKDPQIDRILMKACAPMITRFCQAVMANDETQAGDIMECMIENKNDPEMDEKCYVGIQHYQLIALKDYHFSFKFKEACKADVMKHCTSARRKAEVIRCLSELVKNDTLLGKPQRMSAGCNVQLGKQLLQRSENIELDPELRDNCAEDVRKLCPNVTPGKSSVIRCLRQNQAALSTTCHGVLFKREKEEARDPTKDYLLFTACKRMIKKHCPSKTTDNVFVCLRHHKEDEDFDDKCRSVVILRQRLRSHDIRLNPALEKQCSLDLHKYCHYDAASKLQAHEIEGFYLRCLKVKFAEKRLSDSCGVYMADIIKEAHLDYRQDPSLAAACKYELHQFCSGAVILESEQGHGQVEQCLEQQIRAGNISNVACVTEVLRLFSENKADVHLDPLLHKACSLDLAYYCKEVLRGDGRQMACLLNGLHDDTSPLKPDCRRMLQDRIDMWESAAKMAPPETIQDLVVQVTSSSANHYFMIVFTAAVFTIFCGGLFCGRVTKRISHATKTK